MPISAGDKEASGRTMEIPGYHDLTVLGRGGFSVVYRAVQESMEREVAVKVMSVDIAGRDARAKFRREAATNGRVGGHPNIVTLYDSGFATDGSPYLAMQLCGGGSLTDKVRASGPLSVAETLRIGVKVAAALHYAHASGVLHRDIKPENILLTEFAEPALADFGIAAVDDHRMSTATAASFTISHAAPEALTGDPPTPSADVYSLCSSLFTVLAGHPPFAVANSSPVALMYKVLHDAAPRTGRDDVPDGLEVLLAAGLSKTPAGRPSDAKALGTALQGVQADLGLPVTEFPTAPPPLVFSPTQLLGSVGAGPGAAADSVAGDRPLATQDLPPTGFMPPTGLMQAPGLMPSHDLVPPPPMSPGASVYRPPGSGSLSLPAAGSYVSPPGSGRGALPAELRPPPTGPQRNPSTRRWVALVALVVLLAAGAVYLATRPTGGSSTATGSSTTPTPSTRSQTPASSTRRTSDSTSAPAVAPQIASFSSSQFPDGRVSCPAGQASVDVPLSWSSNGDKAYLGVDIGDTSAQADAAKSGLKGTDDNVTLPFNCTATAHVYTLTVVGAGGLATNRTIRFTRITPTTGSSTSNPVSTSDSTTGVSSSTASVGSSTGSPPRSTAPVSAPSSPPSPTTTSRSSAGSATLGSPASIG